MRVAIAGGHGQIAQLLGSLLADRGDHVIGIIRNPAQAGALESRGMEPLVLDLESATVDEVADAVAGCDAIVFAAGAGPGSGVARKYTVDEGASDLCVQAALAAGGIAVLQISAMGTDDPPQDDAVFSHYLRAKAAAEQRLRASGLPHVIVRPGRLTDAAPTGRVQLARHVPRGSVSRADVAAVLVALLDVGDRQAQTLELIAGGVPVAWAVAQATG